MAGHFQDFQTIDIGNKQAKTTVSSNYKTVSQKTHEQTVQARLAGCDMGDEPFEKTHQKIEKQNAQFRIRFTQARGKLCMNQQQFANQLNINKSVVQEIESGKRTVDPGLMQRINNRLSKLLDTR